MAIVRLFNNTIDDVNYIALATNAVRSGIVAAHNVCGQPLESIDSRLKWNLYL
ncbi:MAG: hypothetical protein ACLRQF_08475 [Thomasclavelia ramosa]